MDASANPLLPTAYDVVWTVAVVAIIALLVIALVSVARTAKRLSSIHSLVWTLLIIFVPVVGPLAWLFIGRPGVVRARRAHTRHSLPLTGD
jgi:hypothetical protein